MRYALSISASGAPPTTITELTTAWREQAKELERYQAHAQAATLQLCAAQLDETARRIDDGVLSLADASRRSGYSADHLSKLVATNRIPNAGRKGKPLIRVRDLPKKASPLVRDAAPAYDPIADAQSLRSRGRSAA
jgi:hypothetical protein